MELPFAVESSTAPPLPHPHRVVYQDDNDDEDGSSSLVTAASSRGSLMDASQASYDPIRAALTHPTRGARDYPYANTQNPSSFVSVAPPAASAQPAHQHQHHHRGAAAAGPAGAHHSSSAPPPFSNFDGLDSVLSQFGVTSPPSMGNLSAGNHAPGIQGGAAQQQIPHPSSNPELLNDFTYVTVCETDEGEDDIVLGADEGDFTGSSYLLDAEDRGDRRSDRDSILTLLVRHSTSAMLPPPAGGERENFPSTLERANQLAQSASLAKKRGDLVQAIGCHSDAARLYRDAATLVRDDSPTMRNSLLALSQTQAKTALALKRIVRIRPDAASPFSTSSKSAPGQKPSSHQELVLREKVRGALSNKSEEDISQSTFLGRTTAASDTRPSNPTSSPSSSTPASSEPNPVDEMMELERLLRNMDMAIEMGGSIASLEARTQHRMKNSIVEGSFMVVPPGSNSYMSSSSSSSSVTSSHPPVHVGPQNARQAAPKDVVGTASVRARANRVQSILEASGRPAATTGPAALASNQPGGTGGSNNNNNNKPHAIGTSLDSSWWGNSSQASQVLTSSVISLASGIGVDHSPVMGGCGGGAGPSSTKQLLMHMDSFKTLRDENEALLKEVVGAKAARMEAKAAKEEMLKFQEEYRRRFAALKEALETYRKEHPPVSSPSSNPVSSSEFAKSSSAASEQLARQEQLIKKLTADLKKEKEESKKKDSALQKYETFYREVKARSAAKQRQKETQQLQTQQHAQRQAAQMRHATKPISR